MRTTIVHCKKEPYDIYIGRPSKWGNYFREGVDGSREEIIEKYQEWILSNEELLNDIPELVGKVLGCWCENKPCHGAVLVKLADRFQEKFPEIEEQGNLFE